MSEILSTGITVYRGLFGTSNGRKINIAVEELEVDYKIHPIAIGKGQQFTNEFTALNPNQKIPAVVDQDGPGGEPYVLFESGAILMYLAEKTGLFMPTEPEKKYEVIQWVMFQMGGIGPIFGQVHHFKRAAKEKVPYAINRYFNECKRLYGVLDARLENRSFLANEDLSIADFCVLPWVFRHDWQEINLQDFKNVQRWYEMLMSRPALSKGMEIPK